MESYKLKIQAVEPTENYYRVIFKDSLGSSMCRTPAWAMGVAESVSKGSKVVMCAYNGKWNVQSVLITKKFHKTPSARRLALSIAEKIERSDKDVPKKWAGGSMKGPSHKEGGIQIEVEGGEGVLMKEVMRDPRPKSYSGTNREIVHQMQMEHGGNPMFAKGGMFDIHGGPVNMSHSDILKEADAQIIFWTKQGKEEGWEKEAKENLKYWNHLKDQVTLADGGIISPRKEVSASIQKSISEVLTLPQYSALKPMEAGILYSKFKDYEKLPEVEGEPFYEIRPSYEDKPSLEESMFEKLSQTDYIDYYDGGASLTKSGYKFIDAVNGRLQTRKLVKMGSDLFPEESGIPELIKKADKDKKFTDKELNTLKTKVKAEVQKKPALKKKGDKLKHQIKEVMDKRSKRSLIQDKAKKAMHPGKRISNTGNVYYERRTNRSDLDRRTRLEQGGAVYDDTIGQTILEQLGGNRFIAMTGAKDFGYDNKTYTLSFKIGKNASKANYVKIHLTPMDTYDMTFLNIRGPNYEEVKTYKGIYADQLQELFTETTGLYTRLRHGGEIHNYEI